jgi:hypothetical protein
VSFNEQLIITIVDKLAIGLTIVLVGLFANAILERFKSKQALITELAKIRAGRLSEVWELLYEQEALINKSMMKAVSYRLSLWKGAKDRRDYFKKDFQEAISEALSYIKSSEEIAEKFENALEKNRFWIGEKLFRKCRQHKNMLASFAHDFSEAFPENKDLDIENCVDILGQFNTNLSKMDESRIDIEKSLKYIR